MARQRQVFILPSYSAPLFSLRILRGSLGEAISNNHMTNGRLNKNGTTQTDHKAEQFPIEIRAGGSLIRILYNPLVVKKHLEPSDKLSPEIQIEQTKTYPSFLVEYYEGSKVVRLRRNSLAKARAAANDIRTRILNQDVESISLLITGRERRIYLAAQDRLQGFGKELDEVAKEYADAVRLLAPYKLDLPAMAQQAVETARRLNGLPVQTVIDFYQRHGRKVVVVKTLPEIVAELVAAKKADHKGAYHVRDLEIRLRRFAKAFPVPIIDVTSKQIDEWLRGLRSEAKHLKNNSETTEIAGKTRNNYRNAVVQLFNFARDNGYLPNDLATAAKSTQRVKEEPSENEIFTPKEMEELLDFVPAHLIPSMVIKAFSGVRTEEISKIKWEMIRFDQDCIVLSAKITKLTQRRTIALKPNLKAWLEPFKSCKGRICERWSSPQAVFQAWERYAVKKGIRIGGNKFRNSYISFRVAETKNSALVSSESGNSPAVIQREYLELAPSEDATKWFSIKPSAEKQKELRHYADELLKGQDDQSAVEESQDT